MRMLMVAALAGDEASYRALLGQAGGRLRAYYGRKLGAGHAATEDLVQDTLIAVHTRRFTYDPSRPFTAWLHAIARYKLIDHFRQHRRGAAVPLDDAEAFLGTDDAEATNARLDVDRLLEQLPERPRRYIQAVKIEGRSLAEVSAATGTSETAIKVAIHRGLKLLAQRLKGRNDR